MVLAATGAFAQSAQPGNSSSMVMQRQSGAGKRSAVADRSTDPLGVSAMREHVADMESTLSKMHGVLTQMQSTAAKSKVPNSASKANLELWELMVEDLDQDLQQLRSTLAVREDMEVRRIALYKQADAKAEAAARAAQAARFAQAQKNATGASTPAASEAGTGQGAVQNAISPQPSDAQPTVNSASPN
jgi:hypothetical protein